MKPGNYKTRLNEYNIKKYYEAGYILGFDATDYNKHFNGKHQLTVINYPGHQGTTVENNVLLVFTPDGLSFVQTGD